MHRWACLALLVALGCGGKHKGEVTAAPTDAATTSSRASEATTIRGTVVGVDGQPPPMAHVRVMRPGDGDPEVAEIDVDGRFELKTTRRGLAFLELTGVDHAQMQVPIVLDDAPIELEATLGTYPRTAELAGMQIVFWTGDPRQEKPSQAPLTRNDDGTHSIAITTHAPELRYQLTGFTSDGRIVNGPVADRYEYDGGGDYRSIVIPDGGTVDVVVDPERLLAADRDWKLTFPSSPRLQRLADFEAHLHRATREFQAALAARFDEDPAHAQELFETYDWSTARQASRDMIAAESDPLVRRAMVAGYFRVGNFDADEATDTEQALAETLLADMKATDPAWQLWPDAMATAVDVSADPERVDRFEAMLAEELPPAQAATFVFERLVAATMAGDTDGARRWFGLMQSPRFEGSPMARLAGQFDPDRAIQPGRPLPAFEFAALPDAKGRVGRKFSEEDLHGTVYLVDFWATWCGPCVADMPSLHAAYEKYGARGKQGRKRKGRKFEILSVSVDADPAVVHRFRDDRFAMPWNHAHVQVQDAAKIFGFAGIPFAVLVDEKGTILASTPQLNGRSLDDLLQQVLADPPPPKG